MKLNLAYKETIQGYGDVYETIKMTEKISSSSIVFLKSEVRNLNAYAASIEELLIRLSRFHSSADHALLTGSGSQEAAGRAGNAALLLVTGDKGLVGGLWHALIGAFLERRRAYRSVIVLGEKGRSYLEEEGIPVVKSFGGYAGIPGQEEVSEVWTYLFDSFKNRSFAKVDVLFPQFVSLAEQHPVLVPFLPFAFAPGEGAAAADAEAPSGLPIFEPARRVIFDRLLRKFIGMHLRKIILEAKLSELSARTVAMEHAGEKTKELLRQLTASYRKDRRRLVTERQLESFTAHRTNEHLDADPASYGV
jgi:F-type H+-transporting ATPase subunit gamma